MNVTKDKATGFFVSIPVSLEAVLARLDVLSRQPEFALQREAGLARALKPYLREDGEVLAALPQERELAYLSLVCDYYPEDGQLTLIEQLRDVITEHIPDDERAWLDPLKHSYLDLLELVKASTSDRINLRSLGDGRTFVVPYEDFAKDLSPGQVLLTRVIHDPKRTESHEAVWAGCGLILSQSEGKTLYERARDLERRMEMSSGELVLGDWQEFTKRFGHLLLWIFAEMRVAALVDAIAHIRYRTPSDEPYLYAIALYDQHDHRLFAEGLSRMGNWQPQPSAVETGDGNADRGSGTHVWVQRSVSRNETAIAARLTLTSSQLIVECDSPERLDDVKHSLARAFGFALHFRAETLTPPYHEVPVERLQSDQGITMVVSHEDDRAMLKAFLEKAYLEWSDQPHQLLGRQTPRHAARLPGTRDAVARLIAEMEASDLAVKRGGERAYDYNILRGHVGIDPNEPERISQPPRR